MLFDTKFTIATYNKISFCKGGKSLEQPRFGKTHR
jgi:hypothetical protein